MIKFLKNNKLIQQFIKYFGVGLIAFIVNFVALYIFYDFLHFNLIVANVFAFILGLITNYILSKKYVFLDEVKINLIVEFIIYGIIGVIGLVIDTYVLFLFTNTFNLYYLLSKIISTGITFCWNFGARKILYIIVLKWRKK